MTTIHLTSQEFKEKVFNYDINKEWQYQGTLPAIVDFYADWCGPCRMVAPVLEDLAEEYDGRLIIYKINTDIEQEVSFVFGIQSIPTMLFIDANGQAVMQPGALPRHAFKKIIEEKLLTPAKAV